ncbi:MAG: hypothetical protein LH603_00075 [Pseudonocardia sp.]|nr:hypothetical protein [Pseudonocardia sp.]
MGVLGEMFPGPKILDEAAEAGGGESWRLGPIDLDRGVVQVHRGGPAAGAPDEAVQERVEDEGPARTS